MSSILCVILPDTGRQALRKMRALEITSTGNSKAETLQSEEEGTKETKGESLDGRLRNDLASQKTFLILEIKRMSCLASLSFKVVRDYMTVCQGGGGKKSSTELGLTNL